MKDQVLVVRLSKHQKEVISQKSEEEEMGMSQFVWHCIMSFVSRKEKKKCK